jgi:hypothetical protein
VILGFWQFESINGTSQRGTVAQAEVKQRLALPTLGITLRPEFCLLLPNPSGCFENISGGMFDNGLGFRPPGDTPKVGCAAEKLKAFRNLLEKFVAEVHANYQQE